MALMWAQTIFGMRTTYTTTALKNELVIRDFCNEMFSGGPWPEANLMICVGAALTENKRAFNGVVPGNTTDITGVEMTESERIVRWDCVKDFFGTNKLLFFRHLVFRDLVFESLT